MLVPSNALPLYLYNGGVVVISLFTYPRLEAEEAVSRVLSLSRNHQRVCKERVKLLQFPLKVFTPLVFLVLFIVALFSRNPAARSSSTRPC
jgi:hypothetical protein